MLATAHAPSQQYQYTTYISTYVNGGRTRSEQQAIFNDMMHQHDILQQVNDCMNNNNNDTSSLAEQEYDIDMRINLLRQQQQSPTSRSSNNNNSKERRSSWSTVLDNISSFIDDITTCGLYFCGLDNNNDNEEDNDDAIQRQKAKDRRKSGIDDTFMGKVISCVPSSCGGHNSCGAVRGVVLDDDTTIATSPSSVSQCLDEI